MQKTWPSILLAPLMLAALTSSAPARDTFGQSVLNGLLGGFVDQVERAARPSRKAQADRRGEGQGSWTGIGAVNGKGATVCNTAGDYYSCFALRCGKGRGMEFAFIYNVGNYPDPAAARLSVDGRSLENLSFETVAAGREMVSPFDPERHRDLLAALKAGRSFGLQFGRIGHDYSLSGSTRAIGEALAQCAGDIPETGELMSGDPAEDNETLVWREGDDRAAYVRRVRAAARPFGGACETERRTAQALAASVAVSRAGTGPVRSGQPVNLDWTSAAAPDAPPAYLVVHTADHVRFGGSGYYTLLPDARAPFGIEAHASSTRAIVPLGGRHEGKGALSIHPLLAGEASIGWSVVAYLRACEEEVVVPLSTLSVSVQPGPPVIAVDDPFATAAPLNVIASPDGTRIIREFTTSFQLVATQPMAVLGDYPGTVPRFSPTGRFVTFRNGETNIDETQPAPPNIIDAIDGMSTGNTVPSPAAWTNGDSFVVGDVKTYGIVDVVNPLRAKGVVSGNTLSCFACAGWSDGAIRIDLENGTAVFSVSPEERKAAAGQSTDGDTTVIKGLWSKPDSPPYESLPDFAKLFQVSATRIPSGWEFEGGLRFTLPAETTYESDNPAIAGQERHLLAPRLVEDRSAALQIADNLTSHRSIEWRGVVRMPQAKRDHDGLLARLEEFGLVSARQVQPEERVDARRTWNRGTSDEDLGRLRRKFHAWQPRLKDFIRPTEMILSNGATTTRGCGTTTSPDDGGNREAFDVTDIGAFGIWTVEGRDFRFIEIDCNEGARAGASWQEFYVLDPSKPKGMRRVEFGGGRYDMYDGGVLVGWNQSGASVGQVDRLDAVSKISFVERNSVTSDVRLTRDRKHLMRLNTDGSFFVHRVDGGRPLLQGRYLDDELVVWDESLNFDATAEGASYVSARFPGSSGQYALSQLAAGLRVPGLVEQALAGDMPGSRDVRVPPSLAVELRDSGGRISGTARPGPTATRLFIHQDASRTEVVEIAGRTEVPLSFSRRPGSRWVSVVASDADGLLSLPQGAVFDPAPGPAPKLHPVVVAADVYTDPRLSALDYAVSDGRKFLAAVSAASPGVLDPVTAWNAQATPAGVLASVRATVEAAAPEDTIAFFFAGHGVTDEAGRLYLATTGTDATRISETAIAWTQLAAEFARSKSRILVFLDACHAGSVDAALLATNDDAAAAFLGDGIGNLVVFAASKGRQLSEEHGGRGGIFTDAVARVISTSRDLYDVNGNGAIEVSELHAGVKRIVVDTTEGRQTPWLVRAHVAGDFGVF